RSSGEYRRSMYASRRPETERFPRYARPGRGASPGPWRPAEYGPREAPGSSRSGETGTEAPRQRGASREEGEAGTASATEDGRRSITSAASVAVGRPKR